jgi:short-subunit dehydrogenase
MKRTVLVTGASAGFGSHLAHAFAHAGFVVVLHGRDEKKLRAVRDEIFEKEKIECPVVVADLRETDGVAAVTAALRSYSVNTLINNAGVNPELDRGGTMGSTKDIAEVISTNASAAIALCCAAFEQFKTLGDGTIININSVAGLRGSAHEPLYAASKFGLRGFSESVKEDWLKEGVKMIDVYPGALTTGMSAKRADVDKLIDAQELAELLVGLCGTRSFFVKELNVRRTIV